MCKKISKIMNFGLKNGMYGTLSEEDIREYCIAYNTEIYNQDLASLKDLVDYAASTGEIFEGLLEIQEGIYTWEDMRELEKDIAKVEVEEDYICKLTNAEIQEIIDDIEDDLSIEIDAFVGYRKVS